MGNYFNANQHKKDGKVSVNRNISFLKYLASLLFYFYSFSWSYSQSEKSKIFIEASFNPASYSFETPSRFRFEVDLKAGVLLKKNIGIGLGAGAIMWRNKKEHLPQGVSVLSLPSSTKIKGELSAYSSDAFFRYFFHFNKITIFPEVGIGCSFLKWKYDEYGALSGSATQVYAKTGLGFYYFVRKNISLLVLASYRQSTSNPIPFNYYFFRDRFSFHLGASVFLP